MIGPLDYLLWWTSTPWGVALLLAATTGIAVWLAAAGYGARWLAGRLLDWTPEPSLRRQLDAAWAEADALRVRAAQVPEPERRARHLAAAWVDSEDLDRVAAGSELGLVLSGALSVAAVAGALAPCVAPCGICGRPAGRTATGTSDDDGPATAALEVLGDGLRQAGHLPTTESRCPTCGGGMETCRCGTHKPRIPHTTGGAQ